MKIKLESKQGVEVLADTLDETLDALQVRPVEVPSERVASNATSAKRNLTAFPVPPRRSTTRRRTPGWRTCCSARASRRSRNAS